MVKRPPDKYKQVGSREEEGGGGGNEEEGMRREEEEGMRRRRIHTGEGHYGCTTTITTTTTDNNNTMSSSPSSFSSPAVIGFRFRFVGRGGCYQTTYLSMLSFLASMFALNSLVGMAMGGIIIMWKLW